MLNQAIQQAAEVLRKAQETGLACEPIRELISGQNPKSAYAIQAFNTEFFLKQGRKIVGRKIGLTSKVVQEQLGVDQPDYGILYADMLRKEGTQINLSDVMQTKIEAEIAFVLAKDLNQKENAIEDVIDAIAYVSPALEIVGSRIKNWDITYADTVADNGSSGLFVLGNSQCKLDQIDLIVCEMVLERSGEKVSEGSGSACMGNPINAVLWLANTMALTKYPLRAGDIILSGALGPMVEVNAGDNFEARISGLGSVSAMFSD
jgi:2-keto-4-pentenoate hydratase